MKILNIKGFTLIELMVVIVIIGVLAAVAIPKLLGMSNKAKAAEAPQLLHTYEAIQSAQLAQTGKIANVLSELKIGTLTNGVSDGKTKFFEYKEVDLFGELVANARKVFANCAIADAIWKLKVTVDTKVIRTQPTSQNCKDLTPSFTS